MRYRWRAWGLFGGGALFGLLAGAALYAPPDLENQPPPWEHWARDRGQAAAATQTAGAGAAPSVPAQPASVAPEPMAAGSNSAPVAQAPGVEATAAASLPAASPAPALQEATFIQPPAKLATASRTPAVKKRKVQTEELHFDTSVVGAGPAPETTRAEPEALRAPAEYTPPRSEGEFIDVAR